MSFTPDTPASEFRERLPLPPLILHPFAGANDSGKLLDSSRAGMIIEGLLPENGRSRSELDLALLDVRYCELKMLFYVGRDLGRWIAQCLETAQRHPDRFPPGVCRQSVASYLVQNTPSKVVDKLEKWGVHGYRRIFSRALALNCIFAEAPEAAILADDFIRHYFRLADQIYASEQAKIHPELNPRDYDFDLYASGEYSRILERSWEEESADQRAD